MSDARECLICGQALEYLQEQQEMVCSFCGKTFLSNTKCRDGHYICDACHEKKGLEEVMHICGGSESKNPLEKPAENNGITIQLNAWTVTTRYGRRG